MTTTLKTLQAKYSSIVKRAKKNPKEFIVLPALFLIVIFMLVGVQLVQYVQDLRQQASIADGQVVITTRQSPTDLKAGEPATITYSVNTNGTLVDGIQLRFDVIGQFQSAPTIYLLDLNKFEHIATQEIVQTSNGYSVFFAIAPPRVLNVEKQQREPVPFSNTTSEDILELRFVPSQEQTVSIVYNQELSKSEKSCLPGATPQDEKVCPPQDQKEALRILTDTSHIVSAPIAEATVTLEPSPTGTEGPSPTPSLTPIVTVDVTVAPTVTNTIIPTATNTVVPTATNTLIPTATNTLVPTATRTPTITLTPSATPPGYVAPTATTTQYIAQATTTPGIGGPGTRSCNQSCSSNIECEVNHMCYQGTCRLANNPTNIFCQAPVNSGVAAVQRVCNAYCSDSTECDTGLTCYYNYCRNPRNISDTYCSDPVAYVDTSTQTSTYVPPVATYVEPDNTLLTQAPLFEEYADYGVIAAEPTATPQPTMSSAIAELPEEEVTGLQRVQGWLRNLLILSLIISAIFLLIWFIPILLKKKDDDDDQPPTPTGTTTDTKPAATGTTSGVTQAKNKVDEMYMKWFDSDDEPKTEEKTPPIASL